MYKGLPMPDLGGDGPGVDGMCHNKDYIYYLITMDRDCHLADDIVDAERCP